MAAPTAGFSKVINYLTVAFTDTSVNTPTTWSWDFGDGSPLSNSQNPVHIYTTPGSYNVTLTVTNADGSDQETQLMVLGLPIAAFQFTPQLLVVQFQDITSNTPTTWSWNFGDGSPVDTTQNPSHTYSLAGLYTVTLTASNAGGSSTYSRNINVAETPVLPLSLRDFIDARLPRGIAYDTEFRDALIAKWQIYLSTLVDPFISDANIFNENAWPPLVNALIASLVAYELMMSIAQNAYLVAISGGGSNQSTNTGSGSGSTVTTGGGGIKKIVTGPSEVEWHNMSQAMANYFRSSGNSGSSNGNSGSLGPLDAMQMDICMLAARLSIYLPMCPRVPKPIFAPTIIGRDTYAPMETRKVYHLAPNSTLMAYYQNGYITI